VAINAKAGTATPLHQMSVFNFNRIGTATTGPSILMKRIDYNDLDRVDSVTTVDLAGVPMKIVSHRDIPKGEIHMVQNARCVGKIINCE
jgi:hypothetical protein